ncbi:pyridoxamine 5'-phosphate oxidase family protein [Microbacterium sp. NEAU-LLC]|uniref:Pyridoxamine 5'-phosphate oxidase family protein n=1 Tax=Microbacterium helvum TaxID=2773713 RepID=A0ABR8NQI9_9MICO|nr:pyridoxamine 5'-phosphate oxidase family protein [Microbacterium helvum]MBD3942728.1 pyridoxamine 5'-phosphate oxidase family protein [Microbacterium helvum]
MTSGSVTFDAARVALDLVGANSYLTLATAGVGGHPWASPVWFASRGLELFVWASKPGALHSRNIVENPRVSFVVFDSSRAPGEGSAFYVSALAARAEGAEFDEALAVYNERSIARGLAAWKAGELTEPARHRLYRAVPLESFVLDDHDERLRVM